MDLWNQWVTGGAWLQNIDFKEFVCKFFVLNILPPFGRYSPKKSGWVRKSAGRAGAAVVERRRVRETEGRSVLARARRAACSWCGRVVWGLGVWMRTFFMGVDSLPG